MRGINEIEPLKQLGDPRRSCRAAKVVQIGHQPQVLLAGHKVVDGGELTRHADRGSNPVWVGQESWPAMRACRASAGISVDRMRTIVVLPAPFGPEQGEDRAFGHGEVDAVEHPCLTKGLAQP